MSVRDAPVDPVSARTDDATWRRRVQSDADQIERCLPPGLRRLHSAVVERARLAGARALILSGSTVRNSRTELSDLDYHLVGSKIETKDLSRELDLHVLTEEKLESELLAGDDFVQWSLRFGLLIFDDGVIRRALGLIAERRPWPSVARKRLHAEKSLELARRFVDTGDQDGALMQVRTALSLAARARFLDAGTFPLSRAELPAQLEAIGCPEAARGLAATIYTSPDLAELSTAVRHGAELISGMGELADSKATDQWS